MAASCEDSTAPVVPYLGRLHSDAESIATGSGPQPRPPSTLGCMPTPTLSPHRPTDLLDLPPDVLSLILPLLPPGTRMELRAVCRAWAAWVDGALLASRAVHLNLVGDVPELQQALRSCGRRSLPSSSATLHSNGGCMVPSGQVLPGAESAGGIRKVPTGLLAIKFSQAQALRLWVGCRPPSVLAGRSGGGPAAAAAAAAAADASFSTTAAAARGRDWQCLPGLQLYDSASSALTSLRNQGARLQERLADAGYAAVRSLLWPLVRRWPPLLPPQRPGRRQAGAPPGLRWHAHTRRGGGAQGSEAERPVRLLRRYAQEQPEPCLQPLSACLLPLGGSGTLTALSLVTATSLSPQDLAELAAAFPAVRALALHAHQASGLDSTPVALSCLAPLAPPPPPHPLLRPQPHLQLRSLVLSGVRCGWPHVGGGVSGGGGSGAGGGGVGLASLTGLRSLVLHRTVGRMHRLLSEVRALTALTRLELVRLDFHHSLPPEERTGGELRSLRHKAERQERRREAARETGRQQAGAEGEEEEEEDDEDVFACPLLRLPSSHRASWYLARPDWSATLTALGRAVRPLAGLRVFVCDVEPPEPPREEGEGDGMAGMAWTATAGGGGGGDEPASPWPRLLSSLSRLTSLEHLALPGLPLSSPAQAASLAAALPHLTSLELRALPPAGPAAPADPTGLATHVSPSDTRASIIQDLERYYLGRRYTGCADGGDKGGEPRQEGSEEGAGEAVDSEGGTRLSEGGSRAFAAGSSGGSGGSGGGGSGCLSAFLRLRRLTLRCASVAQLAAHLLLLPPRLEELSTPLWREGPRNDAFMQLTPGYLLLLHTRLLPALRPLRATALAPGTCGFLLGVHQNRVIGRLLVAMLGRWLGGSLRELDLLPLTHPLAATAEEALGCLREAASRMPHLRRLSCVLTLAPDGLLQPDSGAGGGGGGGDSSGSRQGGVFNSGVDAAVTGRVLECLNAMPHLEELRVKVLARRRGCADTWVARRVPLGLLRALRRPVRVVDCCSLDCWVSADDDCAALPIQSACSLAAVASSSDPRVVLAAARAALAARGWHGVLAAAEEEWAAGAMGLGPEREAAWRGEALGG